MRRAIITLIALAAFGTAAQAQTTPAGNRVAKEVFAIVVRTLTGVAWSPQGAEVQAYLDARGTPQKAPGYSDLKRQKAMAACVAWGRSTPSNLVVRSMGLASRSIHQSTAIQRAMFQCEMVKFSENVDDCECSLLARNDEIVLKVPAGFLAQKPGATAQKPPQPTTVTKPPAAVTKEAPFAASWEGIDALMSGTLYYTDDGTGGGIRASLPDGGMKCTGTWQLTGGKYDTPVVPHGTWAIACSGGRAASGTFKSFAPRRGIGVGMDAKGGTVKISYGS